MENGETKRERERKRRALYRELFERACAPGGTSVPAEVVSSERAKGRAREMRKEKGRKAEEEGERSRGGR